MCENTSEKEAQGKPEEIHPFNNSQRGLMQLTLECRQQREQEEVSDRRGVKQSLPTQELHCCLIAICCTEEEEKEAVKGEEVESGERSRMEEKIKLLILLCGYNHLSQLAKR